MKGLGWLPGMFCAAILATGCGGGSGSAGSPPPGGGTPPPPAAGPPPPVIFDESSVPANSDAGRIAWIEDAATAVVPVAAERLDGTGRYLMPGLIDMHAHLMTDAGAEHDLILELAAGVTTVRIMWGSEGDLRWRDQINVGTLLGPSLFVASPGLEGNPPYWPGSVVVAGEAEARTDVGNVNRRVGVMVNGRWFAQSTLMDIARSAQ